ncbi:MAG TPA: alpha/beta hydrolase [Aldersonia sp.]
MAALRGEIVTTDLGPVECLVQGSGSPVLVLHGSPGGIDAAEAMVRFVPRDRFKVVLVSRPGYLRTPLRDDRSIDAEADLHAGLLDALDIAKVGVLAWSGGGPAAFQLAARHRDRVTALVAVSPVTTRYTEPPPGLSKRLLFGNPIGMRLMGLLGRVAPDQVVSGAIGSEGTLEGDEAKQRIKDVLADRDKVRFVVDVTLTASHAGERSAGYANDVAQFDAIEALDLGDIVAPTLLVAGTHDSETPYADISRAAGEIPTSELFVLDHGTHLAFYTHAESAAAQQRALEYLGRTEQ